MKYPIHKSYLLIIQLLHIILSIIFLLMRSITDFHQLTLVQRTNHFFLKKNQISVATQPRRPARRCYNETFIILSIPHTLKKGNQV